MRYFIHKEDEIEINGIVFNEEVLKQFDPDYTKPEGWTRIYIQERKHYLRNRGNQIGDVFPWESGNLYIKSIPELKLIEKQIKLDKETDTAIVD